VGLTEAVAPAALRVMEGETLTECVDVLETEALRLRIVVLVSLLFADTYIYICVLGDMN
jgi:hypothetical protein